MSVIIYDEERHPDSTYASEYPYILRIEPADASFYAAIGYSLLLQLSRIPANGRKTTLGNLNRYLEEGISQQINPALNHEAMKMLPILKDLKNSEVPSFKQFLRQSANTICAGFQVILAQIFAKSHKGLEAEGILRREKVIPHNVYYFENFAECLSIRIVRGTPQENPMIYMHERKEDKISISLYVTNIQSAAFAIMIHSREVEFDSTRNPALVTSLPFMIKQKDLEANKNNLKPNLEGVPRQPSNPPPNPAEYMPKIGSTQAPDPARFVKNPSNPGPTYNNPPNPVFMPISSPNPIPKPQEPMLSSETGIEEHTLEALCRVLNRNNLLLSKKEAKKLRILMRALKESDSKVDTEAFQGVYKGLKNYCENNHSCEEYVILMKSCQKRHCKECLRSLQNPACDCKSIISPADAKFHLNLDQSFARRCLLCEKAADESNSQNIDGKIFHYTCLARLR